MIKGHVSFSCVSSYVLSNLRSSEIGFWINIWFSVFSFATHLFLQIVDGIESSYERLDRRVWDVGSF